MNLDKLQKLDKMISDYPLHTLDVKLGAKIVVAMSGGVDSSVTAALLHHLGFDVIGLTLQLYDHGQALAKKGACCAGQDIHDAKMVAAKMGFPHYVMDMESRFREAVIEDFADSYARGETPIPCVRCNQTVKFQDLLHSAHELGATALATGHYARRIREDNGVVNLYKGIDDSKDQSYFLFATNQEQLDYLRFPLGVLNKEQTRDLATIFGLVVANKPDSQDICFVPNGNYANIVARLRPDAFIEGNIIDLNGKILGRHQGIAHFTIGQRKGLGIGGRKNGEAKGADSTPLYVIALRPDSAEVVVGPYEALARHEIFIQELNWLGKKLPNNNATQAVKLRIRHNMSLVTGQLEVLESGFAHILFDQPQYGVSAGQACVLYDGDRGEKLLGGGWITSKTGLSVGESITIKDHHNLKRQEEVALNV